MNKPKLDSKNNIFDILRFIAILSVVSAHSSAASNTTDNAIIIANKFLHIFGSFGVPLFFFISGYFYISIFNKDFILRKFKSIVIPWIFVETIVWLYVVLRKGGINFGNWFNFIIGNGHSTYYLTVLMILYLIYAYNRQNIFKILSIISISIISNYFTYANLIFENYNINSYLNFLNWAVYFSIGLLIFQYNYFDKISNLFSKYLYIFILIFICFMFFHIQNGISIYYWSKYALMNNFLFIFISIGISKRIKKKSLLERIGRKSFSIYLMHELLVGSIIYVSNYYPNWILVILRPILVIFILYILINSLSFISRKYEKNRIFEILLGIRE